MRVSGPLAACAVLAVVGAAILDDYGVSADESGQIGIAWTNWRYILGEGELRFDPATDRYYGAAFELPVLVAARLPDYRVRGVETGQFDESGRLWEAWAELAGAGGL